MGQYSAVLGGTCNVTLSACSFIGGGKSNTASGYSSFIAGGSANDTKGFANTFILGSSLSASQANFTYVNNIEAKSTINPTKVILSSPNGTRYNITVTNNGALSAGLA